MPGSVNRRVKGLDRTGFGLQYAVVGDTTAEPVTAQVDMWPGAPEDGFSWRSLGMGAVELGTVTPVRKPASLRKQVQARVTAANGILARQGMRLAPSAAYPFMTSDATGCLRIQLAFHGDDGFAKVHAAVRMLLPIIPAISAASPFVQGQATGVLDSVVHLRAQERTTHSALTGHFIPEAVFSQEEYYREVFGPMADVLASSGEAAFDHQTENKRGAIALFDQELIELRVVDMQECTTADLAVAKMIVAVLKALVSGRWVSSYLQRAWSEHDLLPILDDVVRHGGDAMITNREYLLMFGLMKQDEMPAAKLWQHLFVDLYSELGRSTRQGMSHIMEHGCLARRILARLGTTPDTSALQALSGELAGCLASDRMFI